MRTPFLFSIAAGLALSVLSATAEPDEKSDIEIKTKSAEITVTIEKELKGDPALTADLLAEGRKFVAKSRAEADGAFKTNRASFNGRRWTYPDLLRSAVPFTSRRPLSRHPAGRRHLQRRRPSQFAHRCHPVGSRGEEAHRWHPRLFNETSDNGPTMNADDRFRARLAVAPKSSPLERGGARRDEEQPQPMPEQMAVDDQEIQRSIQPSCSQSDPISRRRRPTAAGEASGLIPLLGS